jgi:mannose-6-phosphate isomerase-like protein (cupin superfamily)
MEPKIVKSETLSEYESSERCFISENWSSSAVSIARARVKPGVTTVPHHLVETNEIYVIVRGVGKAKIGKLEPCDVKGGDTVFIPAGTSQQITNIGQSDLVFYCICMPRFAQECYRTEAVGQ